MKLLVCLILLSVIGTAQLVHAQNLSQSLLDDLLAAADADSYGAKKDHTIIVYYNDGPIPDENGNCRGRCATPKERIHCSCSEFVRMWAEQWVRENGKFYAEHYYRNGKYLLQRMAEKPLRRDTPVAQCFEKNAFKMCGGMERIWKYQSTEYGFKDMPRGDGDCESDWGCDGNMKCGQNNCLQRRFGDPWIRSTLYVEDDDCCLDPSKDPTSVRLLEGEGDCDSDSECAGDLECGTSNCVYFDGTHYGGKGTLHGDSHHSRGVKTGLSLKYPQITQFAHKITGKKGAWRYGNGPRWNYGRYQPWYESDDDCCYNPKKPLRKHDYYKRLYSTGRYGKTIDRDYPNSKEGAELDLGLNATSPEVSLQEDAAQGGTATGEIGRKRSSSRLCRARVRV